MNRNRKTQQDTDPRVVGGLYLSGYWGSEYTVLAIEFDSHGWLKSVTVQDDDGTRTHCTAWDTRRDRVVSTPPAVSK